MSAGKIHLSLYEKYYIIAHNVCNEVHVYIRKKGKKSVSMKKLFEKWNSISLILRIVCGTEHVHNNNGLNDAAMALPCMTQGTDKQEEYQQRRNGLQGTYKNISQNGNTGILSVKCQLYWCSDLGCDHRCRYESSQ